MRSSEQPVNFYIRVNFWGDTIFERPKERRANSKMKRHKRTKMKTIITYSFSLLYFRWFPVGQEHCFSPAFGNLAVTDPSRICTEKKDSGLYCDL